MKAIIMAGGEGSRLRPLTCDKPKPLARLCGRPVLDYIMELLHAHGIRRAGVSVKYLSGHIKESYPEGRYKDMELYFAEEEQPLGTAGGVLNAAAPLCDGGGFTEDMLVISGDALCDIDLTEVCAFHKQKGADATLVVRRAADPREYGLVNYADDGRVTGFVEKPNWNQATTDMANTGIYVLSPTALEMIPSGQSCDFAGDLFPAMLSRSMKLYACATERYWCDIGDIDTYIKSAGDILNGKVTQPFVCPVGGVASKRELPSGDYRIIAPVYIGENVKIGDGAEIGPYTVLDNNVTVGKYARVRQSVLLPGAFAGDNSRLTGALLCAGASVGRGGSMFEGSVAGAGVTVGEHAEIKPEVRIWPGKNVQPNALLSENLQRGMAAADLFDEGGISGEAGIDLTPEFCARLGAAVASLKGIDRVGAACSQGNAAHAFKSALLAGILSTGAQSWDFGECLRSQAAFSGAFCGLKAGIYISGGTVCTISLLGEYGLPSGRRMERELQSVLLRGEFSRCSWDSFRAVADMSGMTQLYQQELYRLAPGGLAGIPVSVSCPVKRGEHLMEDTLLRLGAELGGACRLNLSADGSMLSVNDPVCGYISFERMLAMCCLAEFMSGRDVALPYDAPRIIDELAGRHGRRVHRYLVCPAGDSDREQRQMAGTQPFLRDGIMMAVRLLNFLREHDMNMSELSGYIPPFAIFERVLTLDDAPTRALKGLASDEPDGEGVFLRQEKGSVLLRPLRRGNKLRVLAEGYSQETAEEICLEACLKLGNRSTKSPSPSAPPGKS